MKHIFTPLFSISFLLVSLMSACDSQPNDGKMHYPETFRGTVATNYFGTTVADPYRWLEQENDPEVKNWVDAQNEVTQNYIKSISFRDSIFGRMKEIWNYPKYSTPTKHGEYYFYYKNDGLQNQSILYKQTGLNGKASVFLDPNQLSKDGTTAISGIYFSNDNKYMVYSVSKAGSDWNEFYIKDVATGEQLKDELKWIKFSGAAWFKNGFFYTRYPEPKGNDALSGQNTDAKIYYHEVGKPQSEDRLIFEYPKNRLIGLGAQTTEDDKHLLIYLSEGATDNSALYYKDLTKDIAPVVPIVDNFDNLYTVIEASDKGGLFVLTDKDAPRRRIVKLDAGKADPKKWRVIVPQHATGTLQSASIVGGKLICTYTIDAKHEVKVYDLEGKYLYDVALPGLGQVSGFGGEKTDSLTFFSFTSFTHPTTIYQYDIVNNLATVFKKPEIKFPIDQYETKLVFVETKDTADSVKVPMFITYKKGTRFDGSNPTLLYGYGGFNISVLPSFSTTNLVFLEQGGIYASVCLRGGGEYGDDWHKAGMLEKKQNVFNDFIAAAEFLCKGKYTSPEKLAIYGRSNGGLLIGAVMAQRPDLCKVALPAVGVMDMLRFHKFTIGHAWTTEYGCADTDRKQFENLFKYSPLHNLKKGTKYPATLVTTADHDDRVVPAHSYKFISELQHTQGGDAPVLIRIETSAGHGAGKSTTKQIEEWADIWAFTFKNLGMKYSR